MFCFARRIGTAVVIPFPLSAGRRDSWHSSPSASVPPFHGQAERGRRGRKLSDNAVLIAGATGTQPPMRRTGTIRSRKARHIGGRKGSQMLKAPYKKDSCCGTRAPAALVFIKDRSAVFLYSGAFPALRLLHCCQSDDGKPRMDANENEPHSPGKDGPLQYGF